jgi:hypothetical protein
MFFLRRRALKAFRPFSLARRRYSETGLSDNPTATPHILGREMITRNKEFEIIARFDAHAL